MEKKNFPITESIPLKENKEKELVEFIKAISEQLRNEGIPVKDDGRIDMDAFEGELSSKNDIEADKKVVEEYEKEWHKDLSQEEIEKSKTKRDGPKLEMFKTALFNKFLNKDFIVARSSEFDDIKRGIDSVIGKFFFSIIQKYKRDYLLASLCTVVALHHLQYFLNSSFLSTVFLFLRV